MGGTEGLTVGGNDGITVGSEVGMSVGRAVGLVVGILDTVGDGEGTASNRPLTIQNVVFATSSVLGRLIPPLMDGEASSKSAIAKEAVKVGMVRKDMLNK